MKITKFFIMTILLQVEFSFCFTEVLVASPFNIDSMPEGSSITLPGRTEIESSLNQELWLTSTDSPQSLKLSVKKINSSQKTHEFLKIAVMDKNQDMTRFVRVKINDEFIYNFRKINSARFRPMLESGRSLEPGNGLKLIIHSNKAMQVARTRIQPKF